MGARPASSEVPHPWQPQAPRCHRSAHLSSHTASYSRRRGRRRRRRLRSRPPPPSGARGCRPGAPAAQNYQEGPLAIGREAHMFLAGAPAVAEQMGRKGAALCFRSSTKYVGVCCFSGVERRARGSRQEAVGRCRPGSSARGRASALTYLLGWPLTGKRHALSQGLPPLPA
jgi:hypothetical protein